MTSTAIRVVWPDGAPDGRVSAGEPAGTLAERIARTGRALNTRCGRRGLCAGCTVELVAGGFRQHDGRIIAAPAEVKACEGDVAAGEAVVLVPLRSLAVHPAQAVTTFRLGVPAAHAPLVPVRPGVIDHGLAIDVGTTTVVVAVVELTSGRIVREECAFNRQIEFGDDVITRIHLAGTDGRREALRQAIVVRTLGPMIRDACAAAGLSPRRIAAAAVAGNTAMLHLLTGTDPTSMGVAPFQAAFTAHRTLSAGELELRGLRSEIPVHLLPGFSAYVGADVLAGCVCTGLFEQPGPALLVDVGTNGEILLQHGGRLFATATAAGPAFEGGRLTRGTRAVPGAIARVAFRGGAFDPEVELVPGAAGAIGFCGSAYVDFLAQARRIALLRPNGRLDAAAWSGLPAPHRHENDNGRGVRLRGNDPATLITEGDVAQLLQAKAAIAAGILTLLRRAGLVAGEVTRLYVAGGFGLHLDVRHAIACGLLPGFTPEQIEVVGNTSLGGAWLALVDRTALPEMERVSSAAEIVELNLDPEFENTFIDQLALP
jgi:uncharacterized 2Fe-2S/4Fe-4S cluster protein (DUF4445 family)